MLHPLTLENDVVLLTFLDKTRDPARSEHRLQRAADLSDGHAEIGGTVVIDQHPDLRLGLLVVPVDSLETRIRFLDPVDQDIAPFRQLGVGAAANDELHGFLDTLAEALAHQRKCTHTGQVGQASAHVVHDLPRAPPPCPVVQYVDHDTAVEYRKIAEGPRCTDQQTRNLAGLDQRHQSSLNLIHILFHVFVSRAFWAADNDKESAAVLLRRILAGHLFDQPLRPDKNREKDQPNEPSMMQGATQHP